MSKEKKEQAIVPIDIGGEMVSPDEIANILSDTTGSSDNMLDSLAVYRQGKEESFMQGDEKRACVYGVFLMSVRPQRAWWESQTMDGSPPKCFSNEGGVPHPYAEPQSNECAGCPHNEMGTASVGKGKACKTKASDFIFQVIDAFEVSDGKSAPVALLTPNDIVGPAVLQYSIANAAATKNFASFTRACAEMKTFPQGVVSRWSLGKERTKSGVDYNACAIEIVGVLPEPKDAPEIWGKIFGEVKKLKSGIALDILTMLSGSAPEEG